MGVQINGSEGNVIATKGTFSGDVGIGGTLTYEDVTNIDSVGLVTARSGIEIGARPGVAASISVDGNMIVSGITTFTPGGSEVMRINSNGLLAYNDISFFGASTHAYWDKSSSKFILNDNTKLTVGSSSDLDLYHDGTSSYIDNDTGYLYLRSDYLAIRSASSENYIIAETNGTVQLYYDNEKMFQTNQDGAEFFDSDNNLNLYFTCNGTRRGYIFVDSTNGGKISLYDNQDHPMLSATKDGAVDLYYDNSKKLETTSGGALVTGDFFLNDNGNLTLGTGGDFKIYHDGTNNVFNHVNGSSTRFMHGSEKMLVMTPDSHVELYYDNSKKFNTTSTGTNIVGHVVINETGGTAGKGEIAFGESGRPFIEAFDNGNHGSGAGIDFRSGAGDYFLKMNQDAAVEIYYDDSRKFATTSSGNHSYGQMTFDGRIYPNTDNAYTCGLSNRRWTEVCAVNGSINTSDKTEKNTIVESDLGLDFINKLKPVSYKWNKDDGKTHYGLIAQDVEETLTDIGKTVADFGAISKEKDSPMGLGYSELISPLIKAVQELSAKNDALASEIEQLKSQLNN